MRCETCGAPAILLGNACVFCRVPISDSHAPAELLDYLASRIPGARIKRFGLGRSGPVRELATVIGGQPFEAKLQRGRLRLVPDLPPAQWADRLLGALSAEAAGDAALRSRLSRAGWQLR